tara:strand:- start:387 stop:590 length:204 start_codon:yes stop_codon:yes gene_type:complete
MIKYNGTELASTAHDADIPYITRKECDDFNRKADEWLARRGMSGGWKSNSYRGIDFRKDKRRPSCGG